MKVLETAKFRKRFRRLSKTHQRQVEAVIGKIRRNHSNGTRMARCKPVALASPEVRSCRVTKNHRVIYRAIGPSTLELLTINTHDEAYDEARLYLMLGKLLDDQGEEGESLPFDSASTRDLIESYLEDAHFPDPGRDYVEILASLIERVLVGGTTGEVPPDLHHRAPEVNVIPSSAASPCHPLLVIFCFDDDSLASRLDDMQEHLRNCTDTRLAILVTSVWDPKAWLVHAPHSSTGNLVIEVLLATSTGALTPLPL